MSDSTVISPKMGLTEVNPTYLIVPNCRFWSTAYGNTVGATTHWGQHFRHCLGCWSFRLKSGMTKQCLPDSHLPFVYVTILSISLLWRTGESYLSTKNFENIVLDSHANFWEKLSRDLTEQLKKAKLSWILEQIFQDGCHLTCTRSWVGKRPGNLSVSDSTSTFNIS